MPSTNKKIIMLGCFDTKGEDFSYLFNSIKNLGEDLITINTGVMTTDVDFPIDYDSVVVAQSAETEISKIRNSGDRGLAVDLMGKGAAQIIANLVSKNLIKGAIGMGGGGGTYMAVSAMQNIPLGIPKLCLSTLATKDLSRQVSSKDIVLMPSVVDIAGLNSISQLLIKQAAGAICGMVQIEPLIASEKKESIAISMFGNTTKCVDKCTELLKKEGYDVLAFHATGVGGITMESLIREGCFIAVMDITTTELADNLCDGICSAGPDRMNAAPEMGIPQVVVPGCLDMVNFAQLDTVPEKFKSRQLYSWAPDVTLMRTNAEENEILGKQLSEKVNKSEVPVAVLLPNKGISQIDAEGGIFYQPEFDRVLFNAIKNHTKPEILVKEYDNNINDEEFAKALVKTLLKLINKN